MTHEARRELFFSRMRKSFDKFEARVRKEDTDIDDCFAVLLFTDGEDNNTIAIHNGADESIDQAADRALDLLKDSRDSLLLQTRGTEGEA